MRKPRPEESGNLSTTELWESKPKTAIEVPPAQFNHSYLFSASFLFFIKIISNVRITIKTFQGRTQEPKIVPITSDPITFWEKGSGDFMEGIHIQDKPLAK